MLRLFEPTNVISLERAEVLSEATIDNFHFKVTLNPVEKSSCILWFKDCLVSDIFEALGKFSYFDKRNVLDFIVRYSTSVDLREEIDKRHFERRIDNLSPSYFKVIETLDERSKESAYRTLYDLDDIIEKGELAKKRKIMAKKFHPDAGGDHRAMTVINEAYEFLLTRATP
ncbi:MAG TPA: hypothetical protein DCZ95_08305 [Verrucomicrobia bacterium]|nr:MAG: hypothetical protein A2X46_12340 [Lentisphaerae bacterium GWF2_57_35]HBA84080.1 hypothetical protein [Verrucomicrobiota bacterium]